MSFGGFNVIVRSLSTSVVGHQMVKPPIQVFGLDGRYANALYSAASKTKLLDAVEKELVKLQTTLKTDTRFNEFVLNPTLKRQLKVEAVKQIASKIQLSPPSTNLLGLLAENGRLKNLNGVINLFKTIMAAHRGDLPCEVITAKPLDDATKQELQAALKAFAKKGEHIQLEIKVDPAIIGGMIVSIGDKYVDMSISSKVKKYTELITVSA